LVSLAGLALLYGLLSHDFELRYVYENSSRAMPTAALVTSFWGGQQGSLLLWTWGLSILSVVVQLRYRSAAARWVSGTGDLVLTARLLPYVAAVLLGIEVFFLFILGFVASPFERLAFVPPDGRGLNPLLMDPGMRIHPPLLLMGYMSFSVPFAFA